MKVLYDIEVLGFVHKQRMNRSGLYRVVEEVALELARSPECDLTFCASATYDGARSYLASMKEFAGICLSDPVPGRAIPAVLRGLEDAIQNRKTWRNLPTRVVRKLVTEVAIRNGDWNAMHKAAHEKDLDAAHIYHSGYNAFPDETRGRRHLRRFLTVYDLIPIFFPQFARGDSSTLERIIERLKPDDWVLAISEATKQDLCSFKRFDPERVFVTPLAANSSLFYPSGDKACNAQVRAKYQIPNAPYILSLSTLEPRKNIEHVIQSFAQLVTQQKLADLHLVLVGGKGWDYDAIFDAWEHAGDIKRRIKVTGFVPDDDLAMLYSGALVFVYMSLYEGFGLPPLEAMQCGIPVITADNSSLPEVVGDAGILLNARDMDGLNQSILKIYHDGSLRNTMCTKSLQRAAQFSWKRCADLTINAYRTALHELPTTAASG